MAAAPPTAADLHRRRGLPTRFRPVFSANGWEVQAARWFDKPPGRTPEEVRGFCERLAKEAGLKLVAIDRQVGGLNRALGRFDRLRVVPDSIRTAYDEFWAGAEGALAK